MHIKCKSFCADYRGACLNKVKKTYCFINAVLGQILAILLLCVICLKPFCQVYIIEDMQQKIKSVLKDYKAIKVSEKS